MQSQAAALFHVALVDALARAAIQAASHHQINAIALSGGCFFNRILRGRMQDTLTQAGLTVHLPTDSAFGDAGLAIGQAWVAAHSLQAMRAQPYNTPETTTRNSLCV
jgi:hydrogenase maturation protein HypF